MPVVTPVMPPRSPDKTVEYRRQARRLRWRHRADSSRLLHELRELADIAPPSAGVRTAHGAAGSSTRPMAVRAAAAVFGAAVEEVLESCGSGLRYSKRLELLAEADRLGVGRFEANLIIAVAQHRHGEAPAGEGRKRERSSWVPVLACVALVQTVIVYTACSLLL